MAKNVTFIYPQLTSFFTFIPANPSS